MLELLPEIVKIGVKAIKVEGRQRSPTYVTQVTRTLRAALDSLRNGSERFHVKPAWQAELAKVSEGSQADPGRLQPAVAVSPDALDKRIHDVQP